MQDIPKPLKKIAEHRIGEALNELLGQLGVPFEKWIELTGGGARSVLGYMMAQSPRTYGVADATAFHRWAKWSLRENSTACRYNPGYGGLRPVYLDRGDSATGPEIVRLGMSQGHWIWRTRPGTAPHDDIIHYPPPQASLNRSTESSFDVVRVESTMGAPRALIDINVQVPSVSVPATPQMMAPPIPITPSPQVQPPRPPASTPRQDAPLSALFRYLCGMPACYSYQLMQGTRELRAHIVDEESYGTAQSIVTHRIIFQERAGASASDEGHLIAQPSLLGLFLSERELDLLAEAVGAEADHNTGWLSINSMDQAAKLLHIVGSSRLCPGLELDITDTATTTFIEREAMALFSIGVSYPKADALSSALKSGSRVPVSTTHAIPPSAKARKSTSCGDAGDASAPVLCPSRLPSTVATATIERREEKVYSRPVNCEMLVDISDGPVQSCGRWAASACGNCRKHWRNSLGKRINRVATQLAEEAEDKKKKQAGIFIRERLRWVIRQQRHRLRDNQLRFKNLLQELREHRKEERLVVTDPQLMLELEAWLPIMEKMVSDCHHK